MVEITPLFQIVLGKRRLCQQGLILTCKWALEATEEFPSQYIYTTFMSVFFGGNVIFFKMQEWQLSQSSVFGVNISWGSDFPRSFSYSYKNTQIYIVEHQQCFPPPPCLCFFLTLLQGGVVLSWIGLFCSLYRPYYNPHYTQKYLFCPPPFQVSISIFSIFTVQQKESLLHNVLPAVLSTVKYWNQLVCFFFFFYIDI